MLPLCLDEGLGQNHWHSLCPCVPVSLCLGMMQWRDSFPLAVLVEDICYTHNWMWTSTVTFVGAPLKMDEKMIKIQTFI